MNGALVAAAVFGAAIIVMCECIREGFTFATDACDAINKDGHVYQNSPRLQELCERAETINPSETCLVDCDVRSLCGDPSVGLCRQQANQSPLLCQVTSDYYGSHPDNRDLPEVYRLRRGTCLSVSSDGEVIDNRALRTAAMRFPDEVATVGSSLGHASRLQGSWSMTFEDTPGTDGEHPLPLVNQDYIVEATERARRQGVAAQIPSAVLHESCVSPGGRDTSFITEPVPLQQRIDRAREHENQPPTLHVTARFTLPETTSVTIAGLEYSTQVPGQPDRFSQLSGKKLSVRTDVWLMVSLSPKTSEVTEVREVIKGSDGKTHVTRVRTGGGVKVLGEGTAFVSYTGEPPRLWVGMRDAADDETLI